MTEAFDRAALTAEHEDTLQPVLLIGGPTASGKSRIAVEVAQAFSGVVINADSMQTYRELRVLTARPTPAEELAAPHRLFGVLTLDTPGSVMTWLQMAEAEIRAAWVAGRLPIVVGGTGLYLKALTEGIAALPPIPSFFRTDAADRYERLGGEAFRCELAALDADAAARLPPGDRQRLIRADEVVRATGRTLGEWQGLGDRRPIAARFITVLVLPPRDRLYAAIDARFDRMLAAGVLDEAATLLTRDPTLPGMKALGVRPLLSHLRGEICLEEAVRRAKRDSRRYAKRQLTWMRHQLSAPAMLIEQYSESVHAKLFAFIREILLTHVR